MRKVIAVINMTIDGVFDHTAGLPDEAIHQHYTDLLDSAGTILYGRITYELMQYWQTLVNNPSSKKTSDDFAIAIDKIQKIVFSHNLKNTDWHSATLGTKPLEVFVKELKAQSGKDILIGSRSLIVQLMNLHLIDEFQLCIYPVIAGKGLQLFEPINDRTIFKLIKTKNFTSGAIILYYEPTNSPNSSL
ncbi:MAG: dihydrofolate reductase family protein [Flavobacterium sp.]|nr:dihydrofolate reductase family protein [Flavobacterium sp.]